MVDGCWWHVAICPPVSVSCRSHRSSFWGRCVLVMSIWMLTIVIVMMLLWLDVSAWSCMVTIVMLLVAMTISMHRNLAWIQNAAAFSAVYIAGHPRDSHVKLHCPMKRHPYYYVLILCIDRYTVHAWLLFSQHFFPSRAKIHASSQSTVNVPCGPQQKPPMWYG